MKIIPVYLPQFHTIPENDKWWGKGFTEWVNVKGAKPLFEGHNQPRVPLDDNYYDLSDIETLKWQCKIAKEHGIYGFCMYHYWMNGTLLLHKPMEMLLAHPEIDINYCISWANHDWSDAWKAKDTKPKILISHDFDDEDDWVNHFNYLLPFFKDPRYITENNKPYLVIYIPTLIGKLTKMLDLWNTMAIEAGFEGLTFIYQSAVACFDKSWDRSQFSYGIEFHPGYVRYAIGEKPINPTLIKISRRVKKMFGIKRSISVKEERLKIDSYDKIWEGILKIKPASSNMIPSAFVDWDNTPRYKGKGLVYTGATPEKFKKYFKSLVYRADEVYNQDKIFVFAWNEWAEGGYLEPDKKWGFKYLEAIKSVVEEFNDYKRTK